MPFEVRTRTTVVHTGQPDDSIFKIYLEDGTELIGTDRYPAYPRCTPALHPDFLPDAVKVLVDGEHERLVALTYETMGRIGGAVREAMLPLDLSYEEQMEGIRLAIDRRGISALLNDLAVDKPLEVTVADKTITLAKVVRLEGSA